MNVPVSPDEQGKAVESAVSAMAGDAPADWVSLHAEFAPAEVFATVRTESVAEPAPLTVSPEVLQDIASHQRRAAELGEPWRRLIVDCDRSGRLSVRTVPSRTPTLRLLTWALLALAAVAAVAAIAVFAWRASDNLIGSDSGSDNLIGSGPGSAESTSVVAAPASGVARYARPSNCELQSSKSWRPSAPPARSSANGCGGICPMSSLVGWSSWVAPRPFTT